jgi:hypothetical protein
MDGNALLTHMDAMQSLKYVGCDAMFRDTSLEQPALDAWLAGIEAVEGDIHIQ